MSSFIPNDYWEPFPLIEKTDLAGILVDATIVLNNNNQIKLKSVTVVSGVISLDFYVGSDVIVGTNLVQAAFGVYTSLAGDLSFLGKFTLLFFNGTLPTDAVYNLGAGIDFILSCVTYIDNTVTKLITDQEVIGDVIFKTDKYLSVIGESNVLSISRTVLNPCPTACTTPPVKTINQDFADVDNVNVTGIGYTYVPTTNTVSLVNNLDSCCDCQDQKEIWDYVVYMATQYNSLIENLNSLANLYDSIVAKLDALSAADPNPTCNRWKQLKQLYFPSSLFCRI